MATAYEQKVAFDAVEDATPISVEQVAELLRNFAKVCNKPRLEAMAMVVASDLDALGVETFGDMRQVTSTMYVDDCGVRKLDAQLLVAHFARQVTVEMRGDAPEGGAKEKQHDAAGLGPEEAENTTANGETSPV